MARLACPRCARSGGVRAAGGVRSTEVFERAMIGAVAGLIDAVPEGEGGASHNRSSGNDPNRSFVPKVYRDVGRAVDRRCRGDVLSRRKTMARKLNQRSPVMGSERRQETARRNPTRSNAKFGQMPAR